MNNAISAVKKSKLRLSGAAPAFLFALLIAQPILDAVSYWSNEWNFTSLTTIVRFLMFGGVLLYCFVISDRKWSYVALGGALCAYWILHVIACMKSSGGYASPMSDLSNYLRTIHMPVFTFCFITVFRKSDSVPVYVQKAFLINMVIMLHIELLSYMTGTQIYTYVVASKGLMGWASVHNSQSAILAFVVPLLLLLVYKTGNKYFYYAATVVSFATLFFVGTKVDYFSIFIIAFGMVVLFIIHGEKQIFYYVLLALLAVLCLFCYRASPAAQVLDSHNSSMQVKQTYVNGMINTAEQAERIDIGKDVVINGDTFDSLSPMIRRTVNDIYELYLGPMVNRFGLERVLQKYNYSLDVTNLTAARQQKRFFAELAWEDSNSLTHLFGYEYITLVENYTTTNAVTGITTTRQHIFDLENDFPSVFYFSGYAGFAVYMVFILYFAWLIFVGVVTRFKKLFTLESGLVYMTFALMLGVSQFSGNVLRRPNASIYMSVILAYIYYLTVIKEGVRPTDIFVWPNKKKRAARLAAHESAASAES